MNSSTLYSLLALFVSYLRVFIQETRLSLTHHSSHLYKCTGMLIPRPRKNAPPHMYYNLEYGRTTSVVVGKLEGTPKLGRAGVPPLGVPDPIQTRRSSRAGLPCRIWSL